MKKVLVIKGGISSEREISLQSAATLSQAAKEAGYNVTEYDFTDIVALVNYLHENRPDVILNALHGRYGEDGNIQGVFNLMKIPYTYSGALTSAVCMDKALSKVLVKEIGISTPDGIVDSVENLKHHIDMSFPMVLKPISEGSSVNVHIVFNASELQDVLKTYNDTDTFLVERYIKGRECVVAVLDGKALAVTEIIPKGLFYDYDAKYNAKKAATHIIPADFPKDVYDQALSESERIYQLINAKGGIRIDFIYSEEERKLYFLEINTQSGMTSMSLFPEQAKYRGIGLIDLVTRIIESARYE